MKTIDKIFQLLKVNGPMTAQSLAKELGLTSMGVRQHLQLLEADNQLEFEDRKALRGRPTRYWSLTSKSNAHFTDGHEELTLQLITSVKTIFGDEGLDKLITHREQMSFLQYQRALDNESDLPGKLKALAKLRTHEGYIATIEEKDGIFWLLENHCPICSAAKSCVGFCRSELQLFQKLLNGLASVCREEHIIAGARRCAYKITPLNKD